MPLLTLGESNPKIGKSDASGLGYSTAIMHLAPGNEAGLPINLCPLASAGCLKECLHWQGRGRTECVQTARIKRTQMWYNEPDKFYPQLSNEIRLHCKRATASELLAAIRLNGTSDVPWELKRPELFAEFPDAQFYDYTKIFNRVKPTWKHLPANYQLVFSRSETNHDDCIRALGWGVRVAVVFRDEIPSTWNGFPVVNGDKHDLVFLHPPGVVIGLYAKGTAKKDISGFVVDA